MSRQYFETKVVKVEREGIPKGKGYCPYCKGKITITVMKKPKGNWVNGENLDKIKFPCFCSYFESGKRHMGMICRYVDWYRLYNIEEQSKDNFVDDCTSLENLISHNYDIHILKGKLIIWEEE